LRIAHIFWIICGILVTVPNDLSSPRHSSAVSQVVWLLANVEAGVGGRLESNLQLVCFSSVWQLLASHANATCGGMSDVSEYTA
jgi:hypothetical protein